MFVSMISSNLQKMLHSHNPWKRQKTKGFLMFSGGIKMELLLQKLESIEINANIDTKQVKTIGRKKRPGCFQYAHV